MSRARIEKKRRKRAVAQRRAQLGFPVPCPPRRTGELLVPQGYVGWVLITTPPGSLQRRKVRWLSESGRVWRDDRCLRGGGFHVKVHAVSCRVEPVQVLPVPAPVTPSTHHRDGRRRGLRLGPSVVDEIAAWTHHTAPPHRPATAPPSPNAPSAVQAEHLAAAAGQLPRMHETETYSALMAGRAWR